MLRFCLVILLIIPGLAVVFVCGWFAWQDWVQLQADYAHYQSMANTNAPLRELFIAEAAQNIHRINLFADGVWALLGAILAGLGLHGLAVTGNKNVVQTDQLDKS